MFKLIAVFSAMCAVASAGYLGGYGLGYTAPAATYHAAPIAYAHAPTYLKSYAAPAVVHAPVVKTIAPLATSYANTYKISTKAVPVVHHAPAVAVHAAPAVYAAPAYHTSSTYHGSYGLSPYSYGGYAGYGGYGHGYGHSLLH